VITRAARGGSKVEEQRTPVEDHDRSATRTIIPRQDRELSSSRPFTCRSVSAHDGTEERHEGSGSKGLQVMHWP
jgi:hypothetical protein